MLVDDALDDRETEAGASAAAREERLEDPPEVLRDEPGPGIEDRSGDPLLSGVLDDFPRHDDGRPGGRELDRILEQVLEHLNELLAVHGNGREIERDLVRDDDARALADLFAGA